jgi:6-phosphogluconolactonase
MTSDPAASRGSAATPRVMVEADCAAAAHAAYCHLRGALESAAALRGRATFAFSGGATPRSVYTMWAERAGARWPVWSRLHVFQVDERAVPPDHRESNWRLAAESFLPRVPAVQAERMRGEADDLDAEAARYARRLFEGAPGPSETPVLDAVLLGVGEDGHTASLFPHAPSLHAREPVAVAEAGEPPLVRRLTLTPPALIAARRLFVFVTGESKAEIVRRALEVEGAIEEVPARLLRRAGRRVTWILDRDAASRLSWREAAPPAAALDHDGDRSQEKRR